MTGSSNYTDKAEHDNKNENDELAESSEVYNNTPYLTTNATNNGTTNTTTNRAIRNNIDRVFLPVVSIRLILISIIVTV